MKTSYWIAIFAVLAIAALGVWHAEKHPISTALSGPQPVEVSSTTPSIPDPCVADGTIKTGPGPWKSTLYYLCFQMNSSTVLLNNPDTLNEFGDDGQFEAGAFSVIVLPSAFPVPAPNSCKGVIVSMPWTGYSASPDAKANVVAKKALYDQLSALKSNPNGHVNVVLKLNPYVTVVQTNPLKLRLTECNVFFRDVNGKYVPSLN
jgi:hypothetical protein